MSESNRHRRFARRLFFLVSIPLMTSLAAPVLPGQQPNPANWALDRIDQQSLPLDQKFHRTGGGAGVNIYVIDTGVRITHQDLALRDAAGHITGSRAQYVGDFSGGVFTPGDASDCETGLQGHGTHQASLATGGVYGVAKRAHVWALRAVDNTTHCQGQDSNAIVAAINWVTANGVKPAVVNLSFRPANASVNQAILNSIAAGFTYTLSAGCVGDVATTAGWALGAPDLPSKALIAASTDSSDRTYNSYGSGLAIFAPSVGMTAAANTSDTATYTAPPGECVDSYAAPMVAGVAATYLESHPSAPPAEVRSVIRSLAAQNKVTFRGNPPNSDNLLLQSLSADTLRSGNVLVQKRGSFLSLRAARRRTRPARRHPPSDRVASTPGTMSPSSRPCRWTTPACRTT